MTHDVNAYLEGGAVHFAMHGLQQTLHVAIEAAALQRYFGATAEPHTWLQAYAASFRVIHAVAQLQSQSGGGSLVLGADDFSQEHIHELRTADTR